MGFSTKPQELKDRSKYQQLKFAPENSNTTQKAASFDEEDTQLAQSFESLASNLGAPSPKRPKSNRRSNRPPPSQAAPPAHQPTPKGSKPNNSDPSGQREARRKPLKEADHNSSTKTRPVNTVHPKDSQQDQEDVSTVYEETQVDEDKLDEHPLHNLSLGMDLEFSRDFVFTSTAFSGSKNELLAP
jgi:hypothetical protein